LKNEIKRNPRIREISAKNEAQRTAENETKTAKNKIFKKDN
jgi:hypothetical protein